MKTLRWDLKKDPIHLKVLKLVGASIKAIILQTAT